MARPTAGRLEVEGTLHCDSALHVGGAGGDVEVDLPLARDGRGRWYVPGTSLGGALRAWLAERVGGEVDGLLGFVDGTEGAASRLVVEDAAVTLPAGATVEQRDGVGIDRVTGAAATGIKYDRAVLPRGSTMTLRLELEESPERVDRHRGLLGALLAALRDGRVRLGAATTRGLGAVTLTGVTVRHYPLGDRAGLLTTLRGGHELTLDDLGAASLAEPASIEVEVTWRPRSPVMMAAAADGVAVDTVPLVAHVEEGKLALLLQGSGVKGVLRSHAEWILRTVSGLDASRDPDAKRRFLHQLHDGRRPVELAGWLFGTARATPPTGADAGTPLPGRGALRAEDVHATTHWIDPEQWEEITARGPRRGERPVETEGDSGTGVEAEEHLREALEAACLGEWVGAHHVSVDRWTGGAADHRLFSVLEPHGVTWQPLRLSLALRRIEASRRAPVVALLLLVLRDLRDGRVPLGFATHRGMGALEVESLRVTGRGLDGDLAFLDGEHDLEALDWEEALRQPWRGYLATGEREVSA